MKKRVLMALVIALMIFAAVYASAASLIVDGNTIQAGSDTELRCDIDGVQVDGWGLETSDDTVRNVKIVGVSPACDGAEMFVRVDIDGGSPLFPAKQTAGGSESTVYSFAFGAPFPNPEDIVGIRVWFEGPNVNITPP